MFMHQSGDSPWGPPPGYPREPRGICRDCQIFVARGCGGKYYFCSQILHPRGQTRGICWSAVYPIDDSQMLFQVFTSRPGTHSTQKPYVFSPFLERKRKERNKLNLPRVKCIITGNPVVYIKKNTIQLFGQVEPTAMKYNKL